MQAHADHQNSKKQDADLIAITQTTTSYAVYITSSPSLAAHILSKSTVFHKAVEAFRYRVVSGFGGNVLTSQNGPAHRRHRNIVKGCFSEGIMKASWDAADEAFDTMVQGLEVRDGGMMRDVKSAMLRVSRAYMI
jgi:cytochrome P450